MKKSSAYKIQYDIRPSKQAERRILLDILKIGSEAGLALSTYEYLGFGGFKFYDFEMLFRHLGIRSMTSVERDKSILARCTFNKPFGFITMEGNELSEYLDRAVFRKPIVAWLDYDSSLSGSIVDDALTIGAKAPTGSFVFITIDAKMPLGLRNVSTEQRIADLREELKSFALNPSAIDMELSNFPLYAERVLWAVLVAALSKRTDGQFVPLLRVFYEDTTPMISVGGCLCPKETSQNFSRRMKKDFSFLLPRATASPYSIPPFNFTIRERRLLDYLVTSTKANRKMRKRLREIGLTRAVVEDYKRMVRFVPKYFETYV